MIEFDNITKSMIEGSDEGYVLFLQADESVRDIPEYNFSVLMPNAGNAGVDLCSVENWTREDWSKDGVHLLDLGVRAMMVNIKTQEPVHFWLSPRSSIYKTGYMMANSMGVIDSSYRGILKAPIVRTLAEGDGFKRGNRYFQIIAPDMGRIRAVRACKSLPETERGEGGFGSTG